MVRNPSASGRRGSMQLQTETLLVGSFSSTKHTVNFAADTTLLWSFCKQHYSLEKAIEVAMANGIFATLQALSIYVPRGGLVTADAVVRCDFLPGDPPNRIFIDRKLPQFTDAAGIKTLANEMARRTAECFQYGVIQQYTDLAGNRAVTKITDIDAAPCFWPTPFDETSTRSVMSLALPVTFKTLNGKPYSFYDPAAQTCDCGAAKSKTTHAFWCSTRTVNP
jgi:hypothetical protein